MAEFIDFYSAGNVPEDVIDALYDISPTDVRFTGGIEQQTASSAKKEWLEHALAVPNKDNAAIDAATMTDDSTSQGARIANYCQLTERGIKLGDQAEGSDGFGSITSFETQLGYRVSETARDFEASALSENASVVPVASTTAAKSAGFFAFVKTNTRFGATTGADGGWNASTGVVDAPTAGDTEALSETDIHDVLSECNVSGGQPDQMHMIPQLKTKFSNFMMTSSARIGAIYTPTQGGEGGGATAVASIQMFESDYGALEVIANNIMQPEVNTPGSTRTNVALVDTRYWATATQWSARAKRLGATGHGESWLVSCSKALCALNEASSGAVRDIDYEIAMVQ